MTRHAVARLMERLPHGVRDRPAWMFIGLVYVVVGAGYATGYTDSVISQTVGHVMLRVWGWLDVVVGLLVAVSTGVARPALEKLALRCLYITTLTYSAWLMIALDFNFKRGASSIAFGILLALATQLRVRSLTIYMQSVTKLASDLQRIDDND